MKAETRGGRVAQQQFLARVVPLITELMDRVAAPAADDRQHDGLHDGLRDGLRDDLRDNQRDGLLIGLSGGPDSVALLLAVHQWSLSSGRPLAAAHLNHRLRGPQADADEAFCRELCRRLDVPLHLRHGDPRPVARQRGTGLEDGARILRRRFFRALLAQEPQLRCVATGHHRDDQAETLIMRFFRGTGLDGLRGIQAVSGPFIHPLLTSTRAEILAYLEGENQAYRIDASNVDGDNLRSRVRRELLPLLRELFGPAASAGPVRLAGLVDDDLALLEHLTTTAGAEIATPEGLAVDGLLALDRALARRVIRQHLSPAGSLPDLERKHVDMVLDWLPGSVSGQSLDLGTGLRAIREFSSLRFAGKEFLDRPVSSAETFRILVEPTPWPPPATEVTDTGEVTETSEVTGTTGEVITPSPQRAEIGWRLICPVQAVTGNIRIRNWRPGDRIELWGLGGRKKLSELLQEHRVPREAREGVLVVEDAAGILWVVGHAQAARTRMLPGTTQAVTISVVSRDRF